MKKIALLQKDGFQLLEAIFFQEKTTPLDCILICSHGCGHIRFLNLFPESKSAFSSIPKVLFEKYLRLEYDFGSYELSKGIGECLSKKEKNTALITINYHRGIVDGNRTPNHAIRNIFLKDKFPQLVREFFSLSQQTEKTILDFLGSHLQKQGFFCDVHSMWSSSQFTSPSIYEYPSRLDDYIHAITNPLNQRCIRAINIITEGEREWKTHEKMRYSEFAFCLQKNGYSVLFDEPYTLSMETKGILYHQQFSGIAFDIPQTFLGNQNDNDLSLWHLNKKRIAHLSTSLANALVPR